MPRTVAAGRDGATMQAPPVVIRQDGPASMDPATNPAAVARTTTMADLEIWVIGDPGGSVGALTATFARLGRYDYVRVESLEHMVTSVLRRLGATDRIRRLHITDHGFSYNSREDVKNGWGGHGGQAVGKTDVVSWDGSGDTVGPARLAQMLAPLRPRFAPGAQVMLEGCTVGQANLLLAAVSSALGGVPVSGGSSYQRPTIPGMEGYVRTCVQLPGQPASCRITREASAVGRAGYWLDEKVVVPSIFAVRSGLEKASTIVVHMLEAAGRAQMEAAPYGGIPPY